MSQLTTHRTSARVGAAIATALAAAVVSSAGAGCTRSPHVIGAICPGPAGGTPIDAACGGNVVDAGDAGVDGPAGATLAVELDHSGVSLLEPTLPVGTETLAPALRLLGERATATGWPTEGGPTLGRAAGAVELGLATPFTDGTRAVGLGADAPAFVAADVAVGATGTDDFALEVVLRAAAGATIADKSAGGIGWALAARATGELVLSLRDADPAHLVEIASPPLATGAWFHCVFWVSRAAGGRADCDGRAGTLVPLPALGALDGASPLALGAGAPARLAFLALHRAAPGRLGDASGWQAASARRFATLTGARPRVALGSATPRPGLRDSLATVDLQAAAGAPRRLFLVGPDWPRIACRTDAAGTRDCGFLSEPRRTRGVAAAAHDWTARELAVAPALDRLAADGPVFEALVPSTTAGTHTVALVRDEVAARQVFSFFVRAGASGRVGVVAGTRAPVVFDLRAGTVVTPPAAPARATIEAWGDGVFRCSFAFDGGLKAAELGLHVFDAAGAETFAGDGATAAVEVAGLQLDVGLAFAGSLLAADPQAADRLTFAADDGNLPTGPSVTVDLRVLLPAGPRLTDQAIVNLNRGGTFADQVQVFVRGDLGVVKFWGLRAGVTHWTFDHTTAVTDGVRHALRLGWNVTTARVELDGVPHVEPAMVPNDPPFVLDRIDVGFSAQSSGALEGLVAGLTIGAGP